MFFFSYREIPGLFVHQLVASSGSCWIHNKARDAVMFFSRRHLQIPSDHQKIAGKYMEIHGNSLWRWGYMIREKHTWLVVDLPLWKILYSQLGLLFPIYGKIKHVPKHQPDMYKWWFSRKPCSISDIRNFQMETLLSGLSMIVHTWAILLWIYYGTQHGHLRKRNGTSW